MEKGKKGAKSKMDSPRSIVYLLLMKPRFFFVSTSSYYSGLSLFAKHAAGSEFIESIISKK